jgi:hypothetical protein
MTTSDELAAGTKIFYRPIEAAIRWCGLVKFERTILKKLGQRALPEPNEFPRWPLLRLYAERIFDAMTHYELRYGVAGVVQRGVPLPLHDPRVTVRHVDLKRWIKRYYPGERPAFLFDAIERAVHPSINAATVTAMIAERDALEAQLARLTQAHEALRAEHESLVRATQATGVTNASETDQRSEATYLNIIGGMLALLLGTAPSGAAYSSFRTVGAVVDALLAHYQGRPGLSERTLWSKLGQARRHLGATK